MATRTPEGGGPPDGSAKSARTARPAGIAKAAAAAKAAEVEEDAARRTAVARMTAPSVEGAPQAAPPAAAASRPGDPPGRPEDAKPVAPARPAHEIPDKLYFRIGEVAELVGVEAHVLRYWETEFRLRPTRSSSGQRLYRKSDLARFLRVRQLLHEEGYTIAGARKILLEGAEGPSGLGVEREALRDALRRIRALRAGIAQLMGEVGSS